MMSRRNVSKFLASLGLLAAVPARAAAEPTPTTVPELITWVERHFDCRMGDPRAFTMHMPDRPLQPASVAIREAEPVPYFVMAYGAIGHAEAELVKAIHADFIRLLSETPSAPARLYWRLFGKILLIEELIPVYGPQRIPKEDVEDGLAKIPKGGQLDMQSGDYRPLLGHETRHTIRARIAIPGCNAPLFAAREGETVPLI